MSGGWCYRCGQAGVAGLTHACAPRTATNAHRCSPPTLVGLTIPAQPDWTCGSCGRVFRDFRNVNGLQWWAEIQGPREGVA